jgi:hypothetical protein
MVILALLATLDSPLSGPPRLIAFLYQGLACTAHIGQKGLPDLLKRVILGPPFDPPWLNMACASQY